MAGWIQTTGRKGFRLNWLKMKEEYIAIFINLRPPLGHETLSLKSVTSILFVVHPHLYNCSFQKKKEKSIQSPKISAFSHSPQKLCACWMLATHAQLAQECLSLSSPRWKHESCQAIWGCGGRKSNKLGAAGCYQQNRYPERLERFTLCTSHSLPLYRTNTSREINPQLL